MSVKRYNCHLIWDGEVIGMCKMKYHPKGYLFDTGGYHVVIPFSTIGSEYRKMVNGIQYIEIISL